MAEKTENVKTEKENEEQGFTVELGKPYTFEGKEYNKIDLSGLERLTIQAAIDAQRDMFAQGEAAGSLMCETTSAFAMALAAKASGLPIEFFKKLPIGAGRKVKRLVQGYVSRTREDEGTVLRLKKPHTFNGEVYTEFDLAGIAEMSMLQESAAENTMALEGFIITENSFNYLYACIIASMAVNKPKELFTTLPLNELLNLKEAVNNSDFFA